MTRPRVTPRHHGWHRLAAGGLCLLAAASAIAGCSSSKSGSSSGGVTTITLAGPNQWNDSGSSFGKPWNDLIAAFEKQEPKIKIKTDVLPLKTFNQTISTQLSAGTAPELVFNQATYQPYMVHHLDSELKKPNPYVPGNKRWIDLFNSKYYGYNQANSVDAQGHLNWVPFNLVGIAVFYNKTAFSKAGISAPITTFGDMMTACTKLKTAGYTPFAMEDSDIGVGWSFNALAYQLWAKYYKTLNVYNASGAPGSSPQLTTKDWAKAVLSHQISTSTPEVAETLKLTKQFFDSCVTKNWSGVAGNSGSLVGIRQFASGQAAMTWGTDYASDALSGVKFSYSTMPFPTVTTASSPLSQNFPAQWGVSTGGTSYMIPAKTSGAKLQAAIKFLQFVSAPQHIQAWLAATGAVPAVSGVKIPATAAGFLSGQWGTPAIVGTFPGPPPGITLVDLYDGYLLGSKSLSQEISYLQGMWQKAEVYQVQTSKWTNEPWAKNAK